MTLFLRIAVGAAFFSGIGASAWAASESTLPEKVEFNRDIRPILAENCFKCHGPDKNERKAKLRLDTREGALEDREGFRAIVPKDLENSELQVRIRSDDPEEKMPPPKSGKKLSARDVALLTRWIEQGAEWEEHWSYLPPVRPAAPPITDATWARNEIDKLVAAKLQRVGLHPSPEADRRTLARRLSLDLIGLPPLPEEVESFVHDPAPEAYARLVERLLASPHFGERMAVPWLDLVRYADSIGYHSDNPRQVAPYRDYVIESFNDNKPFDQFTIEQIGGDLLPQASREQKVASAYNRLNMTTEEGGAQAKEYEIKTAADRVRTTSVTWMGATMGCAECHDHKFDPYSTRDFYTFASFFADLQEAPIGPREPGLPVPDSHQETELKRFDERIAILQKKIESLGPALAVAQAEWEKNLGTPVDWVPLVPETLTAAAGTALTADADGAVIASGKFPAKETYTITARTPLQEVAAFRLEALPDSAFPAQGPGASGNGNYVLTEFKVTASGEGQPAQAVALREASADFSQETFKIAAAIDGKNETGWGILPQVGQPHTAVFQAAEPVKNQAGVQLTFTIDHQSKHPAHQIGKLRLSVTSHPAAGGITGLPEKVRAAVAVPSEQRSEEQKSEIAAHYRTIAPLVRTEREEIAREEKLKSEFLKTVPTTLVSVSGPPRVTRILARGNWMDVQGEIVQPAVPHFMKQVDAIDRPANRLDLGRWLASSANPLTARVFMNRLWKMFLGVGISKTLDDLGAQGEWPVNPELLDWLAVEFMDSGWNIKHMVQLIVSSATYRQSSVVASDLRERDPYNREFARQSSFRLDAEFVRDNALAISGLLSPAIGGPSVKPYQPAGYWAQLNFPPRKWEDDKGEAAYRRGLYTHWQRSFLHPSLYAFDAPGREECTADRARSNIPQQALVLLNDPTYVEAARAFAEKIIKEGGEDVVSRLQWAYRRALARPAQVEELRSIGALIEKQRKRYEEDAAAATLITTNGLAPAPADIALAELAAWTSAARVILNLHETITRS